MEVYTLEAIRERVRILMRLMPAPVLAATMRRPLVGLLPQPNLAATMPMPIPIMGLLPEPILAAPIPKPSIGPIKPLMELTIEPPAALQSKLTAEPPIRAATSHIKPLMELNIEPPAALLNPGITKSTMETTDEDIELTEGSNDEDLSLTAGSEQDSTSPKKAGKRATNRTPRSKRPFQRFTSPGGTRRWIRVTTRWLEYAPVGNPLRGTPFICFKTPLKDTYDSKVKERDRFGVADLVNLAPNLGMVIDLTATDRYVDIEEYRKRGIKYRKVLCQGAVLPNIGSVKAFFNAVDEYVMDPQAAGKLIGVHCTHGVNRTGYLVCRYMIQRLGFPPEIAISEFEDARGHKIEREEYLDYLKSQQLEPMPFFVRSTGLTQFLELNFGPKSTNTGIPTLNKRKDGPSEMMNAPQGESFPMNRDNFPQRQSQPPNPLPAGDLRERLSSNARAGGSNFYNKEGNNEVAQMSSQEPRFQQTFYPQADTGNQFQSMSKQSSQATSSQMRGNMDARPGPLQTFPQRGMPDQRADPVQTSYKDDRFQQGFYESNLAMGYKSNMNDNFDIGPNKNFSADLGRSRMFSQGGSMGQGGPMQRNEDISHFSRDLGRPRMLGQSGPMQRNEDIPNFSIDQGRPRMLGQIGTMKRDEELSHFPMNQGRSMMLSRSGPMQRDGDISNFSADKGWPRMLGNSGPMQRDGDLQPIASSGPGPAMMQRGGSVNMGRDGPSDTFGHNSMIPFSSTSSLTVMPGGPKWNALIGSGGSNSGPMAMGASWGEDSRAKNYPGEIPAMQGRNDFPVNKTMDSVTMDNRPQNSIFNNNNIHGRLGERSSRERSIAENLLARDAYRSRSRSRDRRRSRSRSTSRRRSRSSDRSEKRMGMRNQYDKDLFTRRDDGGDRRSRSRDRFASKYEKDFRKSIEKDGEPQRGIEEPNPQIYEQSQTCDNEIMTQKLEHISNLTVKIGKAVSLMRTFNFPQEFYDNPNNSEFIFRARKFQTLSNEIQNSWENFNSTFEEHRPHSIVSKKTVKLDPSQYRKLQPPPEFMGLAELERTAERTEQLEIRRGNLDSQSFEYYSLRAKYNAPN